jgi:hypothetical protein
MIIGSLFSNKEEPIFEMKLMFKTHFLYLCILVRDRAELCLQRIQNMFLNRHVTRKLRDVCVSYVVHQINS